IRHRCSQLAETEQPGRNDQPYAEGYVAPFFPRHDAEQRKQRRKADQDAEDDGISRRSRLRRVLQRPRRDDHPYAEDEIQRVLPVLDGHTVLPPKNDCRTALEEDCEPATGANVVSIAPDGSAGCAIPRAIRST